MGRCNNRRAQQRAQEMASTPSRARFSNPPSRNKKKGRGGGGRGGRGGRGGGRGNAAKASVVNKIAKRVETKMNTPSSGSQSLTVLAPIKSKKEQHQQQASLLLPKKHPLDGINISELDEIVLSEESVQQVYQLLSDLNVKVVKSATTAEEKLEAQNDSHPNKEDDGDDLDLIMEREDEDLLENYNQLYDAIATTTNSNERDDSKKKKQQGNINSNNYSEYEEDIHEDDDYQQQQQQRQQQQYRPFMNGEEVEWEGNDGEQEDDDNDMDSEEDIKSNDDNDDDDDGDDEDEEAEAIRQNPVYLHLTTRFSFTKQDAFLACRAVVEEWEAEASKQQQGEEEHPTLTKATTMTTMMNDDKLGLALDWLCLHLSDEQLQKGFQPNPLLSQQKMHDARKQLLSTNGIILAGTGRTNPIPHPSISIAKKLTTDQEWMKNVVLQERIMGFLQLGFSHSEATRACEDTMLQYNSDTSAANNNNSNTSKQNSKTKNHKAIRDPMTLRLLLQMLEAEILIGEQQQEQQQQDYLQGDVDFMLEEREEEKQVLASIYDDQFQVLNNDKDSDGNISINNNQLDRYLLVITPCEPLQEPARSEECQLYVFIRKGYPTFEPPLFCFTNASFPPTLLRRINTQLIQQCHNHNKSNHDDGGRAPIIYDIITFLSDSLPQMQIDFIKEQRLKEFNAKQLQLRKEMGHNITDDEESEELLFALTENKNLTRKQKSKLHALQKSYNYNELLQQKEIQRKQRQTKRIEQIQKDDKNIRAVMAQKAIQKRQEELLQQELDQVSRSALSKSLNSGDPVEVAREKAEQAKKEYLIEHGYEQQEEQQGDNNNQEEKELNQKEEDNEKQHERGEEKMGVGEENKVDENDINKEPHPGITKSTKTGATPTTIAFMERLREMYSTAVQEKISNTNDDDEDVEEEKDINPRNNARSKKQDSNNHNDSLLDTYRLSAPIREEDDEEEEGKEDINNNDDYDSLEGDNQQEQQQRQHQRHIPRPVAIPIGELAEVMKDVITTQKDRPWLISSDARVPETGRPTDDDNDCSISNRQQGMSRKLKQEHERKYRSVLEWAKNTTTTNNYNSNRSGNNNNNTRGFSPQRFHNMLKQRERLPAYIMKDDIIHTIALNQVTVIAGDTGCGKTTQVPQLVLDDMIMNNIGAEANIIVTQPRRISAIGVSERIASERCERVGETCGYSIMLEKKWTTKTKLLLCTTGILLRRLQCDPDLASVSHVFVDEVHERDLNTDFLLIILKDLLHRRKSLKLVLMSATLNAEAFSNYFGGCAVVEIPGRAHPVESFHLEDILKMTGYEVLEGSDYALKGRNDESARKAQQSTTSQLSPPRLSKSVLRKMYYPKYDTKVIHSLSVVDETVINYELLAELVMHIAMRDDDGAILVFLPGMMEITKAMDEMYKKEFLQSDKVVIYPLHSSLSTADQTAVFDVPPEGVRKIVVATNIAETSITIEDVVYVVDAGRVKENRKDEVNDVTTLVECWVSRASAKQRRGRAGRVRPGIAYHMFSSHTYEQSMQDYQLPEMLRVGLEDLILQILILDLGEPNFFLGKALNAPSTISMRNSLNLLQELGAVECDWTKDDAITSNIDADAAANDVYAAADTDNAASNSCEQLSVSSELTALGFHLATLPVDPHAGKMMIYGALFGCIDPALTIAASMSARSPFVSPFDQRDQADAAKKEFAAESGTMSDHLAVLSAFNTWKGLRSKKGDRAAQNFVRENFLGRQTLFQIEDLRKQFCGLLISIGFLPKNFQLGGRRGTRQQGQGWNGKNNNNNNNNDNSGGIDNFNNENKDSYSRIPNANANNMALVKAVLCAGLYPNILVAPKSLVGGDAGIGSSPKEAGETAFSSLNKGSVYLHPCTIAFSEKRLDSRYCCYREMVKTSKTYVRDCTPVSPFALVLFGGKLQVHQDKGVVTVDKWLKFRIGAKPQTLVKHLRAQMEHILLKKILTPEEDVTGSREGRALIQSISTLLERDTKNRNRDDYDDGGSIVRPWNGTADSQRRGNPQIGGASAGRGRGGRGRGRGRGGGRGRTNQRR